MTSLLDLWCECNTTSTEGGITHHPVPAALSELTGDQVSHCLDSSTAEWIGFSPAMLAASGLEQPLRTTAANVVLAVTNSTSPFRRVWELYPPAVASLVFPPEAEGGVLFRRKTLQAVVTGAVCLWDALIRLVHAGETVEVIDAATADGRSSTWPFLPGLEPEHRPRDWFTRHVEDLDEAMLSVKVRSSADFTALKAGLLQLHDYLDASHSQSQSVEGTQNADYWHGIMHRREPDYSNAKYWLRHVGSHPVFAKLAARVPELIDSFNVKSARSWTPRLLPGGRWDAFAFVDLCQQCNRGGDPELNRVAQCIQLEEMLLLLQQTWQVAT